MNVPSDDSAVVENVVESWDARTVLEAELGLVSAPEGSKEELVTASLSTLAILWVELRREVGLLVDVVSGTLLEMDSTPGDVDTEIVDKDGEEDLDVSLVDTVDSGEGVAVDMLVIVASESGELVDIVLSRILSLLWPLLDTVSGMLLVVLA